jgi:hypothetical protein
MLNTALAPLKSRTQISWHDLSRCVHHPAVSTDGFASLAVPIHRASTIVYNDPQDFAQVRIAVSTAILTGCMARRMDISDGEA